MRMRSVIPPASSAGGAEVRGLLVIAEKPSFIKPTTDEFSNWMRHFAQLEIWVKRRSEHYDKNLEEFFKDSDDVKEACFQMLESSKEMFRLSNLDYLKYEMDKRVWTALYHIFGILRPRSRKESVSEMNRRTNLLMSFIEPACDHFKSLINGAQKIFHIDLAPLWKKSSFLDDEMLSTVAVDFIYRLLICIGDLSRYAMANQVYRRQAFQHYEVARLCDVRRGRAFYNLGVFSEMANDPVGAMYNFVRACSVVYPVDGTGYQILEIHDQAVKEHLDLKDSYWYFQSKYREKTVKWRKSYPREIWVLPRDPKPIIAPAEVPPPSKKQHIASLSDTELRHRFAKTFVLLWGMIYSRIGVDEFEEVAEENLVYFEGLLQRGINMSFLRMMQIVGLSLSIMSCLTPKKDVQKSEMAQYKSESSQIMLYILELFSIVVERLLKLISLKNWDHIQINYLSAAVLTWCNWLERNSKAWTKPQIRPQFSIRRIEKNRYHNRTDPTDDIWDIFAQLMTRLEVVLHRGTEYAFPTVSTSQYYPCQKLVPKFPEYLILHGLPSFSEHSMYQWDYYTSTFHQRRAHLLLRFKYIHQFGSAILTEKLQVLSREQGAFNVYKYSSEVKLLIPKSVDDSCGLAERNFWFWAADHQRLIQKPVKKRMKVIRSRPDCNGARIILREKPKTVTKPSGTYFALTEMHNLWCLMNERGYRSDMIVKPTRILLDTNCFINKLHYVKLLLCVIQRPLLLPVTVVLELKGLSKGGLRVRYREMYSKLDSPEAKEKFQEGNDLAEKCRDILEYIEKNISFFRIVNTSGRIFAVKSIYEKIHDDVFDPNERNDNRIRDTCLQLELDDKRLRNADLPMRLFRNTVLLTGDRGLRVKTVTWEIPARSIDSIVGWFLRTTGETCSGRLGTYCKNMLAVK